MTRNQTGRVLASLAAIGFLGTAALHSTGYGSVSKLAAEVTSELGPLIPALWLVFSFDLTVIGLIVAAVAHRPGPPARLILVIAGLAPLCAALLQLASIGFVPPTAILIAVSALAFAAAAVGPGTASAGL